MAKKHSNVPIFKLRVIIDTEADVFRDLEIETSAHFEDLHLAILDAFDFEAGEMASFYVSNDEWEKGLEIPLMSMDEQGALSMKSTTLDEMLSSPGDKLLYVYDFMRMWIFYVELMEVKKDKPSTIYPRVAMAFGDAPSQDSREMDFGGDAMMLGALEGLELEGAHEEDEDEDEFGTNEEFFDESEFDGQYRDEE